MSLLHRSRTDDDVVVDRDASDIDDHAAIAPMTTRERAWTFAPGQLVSLVVGACVVAFGLVAMVRAGIDGSFDTPVVEVLGYNHTAWLGLAEVGLGLLLILAGTGAWGRPLSVILGAAVVVAGILVLAEPSEMPAELALERAFGWPLIALGALVAVAAMALPIWRTHKVTRDEIDLREDVRRPAHRADPT